MYQSSYINFETARLTLFHYIESWYNRKRIHGAIDYLTPRQLEDLCRKEAILIAKTALFPGFNYLHIFSGRHRWVVFPVSSESCQVRTFT